MDDQTALYNQTAEAGVIGSVLISPETLTTLDITPADFYNHRNRMIWMVIRDLNQTGTPVDFLTVTERLEAKGQLQEVGGPAYLMGLTSATPTSMHASAYAEIVKNKARRRGLAQLANTIAQAAYDEKINLDASTPGFIQALVDTARVRDGARPFSEYASELYDEVIARAENPAEVWGIPSGFNTFDRVTGGIQPGELMILSGEPGVGKSILAMQLGAQMARTTPGAIYSIEMRGLQVVRRLVSGMACVPTRSLKTGKLSEIELAQFTHAIGVLSDLPVFMSDGASWTTTALRADLSRLKAQHGIQWFVLDYLYLLEDGAGGDEIERTALASKGLKRTAKELGVAGIAVHSMNKAGMSTAADAGTPKQSDLRGSGQVIYDADLITFLTKYNPDIDTAPVAMKDRENARMLIFGKGRELENPRKFIRFVKKPEYPFFGEMTDEK